MSDILKCSSLGNWNRSWILKSTLNFLRGVEKTRIEPDQITDRITDRITCKISAFRSMTLSVIRFMIWSTIQSVTLSVIWSMIYSVNLSVIRSGPVQILSTPSFAWRHVKIPILSLSTGIFCSSSWNEYFIVALLYFCIHASKKFFLNAHLVFYLNSTMTLANDVEMSLFFLRLNLYVFKVFAFLLCFTLWFSVFT